MQFQFFFLCKFFKRTVGYDLCACARVCVYLIQPHSPYERVLLCSEPYELYPIVSVCHIQQDGRPQHRIHSPSIHPSSLLSLSRLTEKDILLCTDFCSFLQEIKKKDLSLILQPQARAAQQTEQAKTRLSWNPLKVRPRTSK